MKIVISGDTELSFQFSQKLTNTNDITVILSDESNPEPYNQLDLQVVIGNPTNLNTLNEANISSSNVFLACSDSDELNVISCLAVKQISEAKTYCFVNKDHYFQTFSGDLGESLRIDNIIWPELFLGRYISDILAVPGAIDVKLFGQEDLKLLEFRVTQSSHGIGQQLRNLSLPKGILMLALFRDDKVIIPNGLTTIYRNDKIIFVGHASPMRAVEARFRQDNDKDMDVVIIGGGNVGFNLCKALEPFKHIHVTVVEKNEIQAKYLSNNLSDRILVLNADGSNPNLLKGLNLETCDCLVALTGNDERNLFISLQAKINHAQKVITRAHNIDNISFFDKVGIDVTISSQLNIVQSIIKEISEDGTDIYTFIEKGKAEIREIVVPPKFPSIKLMDLQLPDGIIIAAIRRNNYTIIPSGQDKIKANDHLRIFCKTGNGDLLTNFISDNIRNFAEKEEHNV